MVYEIHVAGPVGPAARSGLPGFTVTTVPPSTVLVGTAAGPDDLLEVINLLTARSAAPIDIWITLDGPG
jgi:hypothetical protein